MRRPSHAVATNLLLSGLMLASLWESCVAASPVPYVVEFKTGEQLERQTQASTGQATGAWFVAFVDGHAKQCYRCDDVVAAMEANAERQMGSVIWAKMDCHGKEDVIKRFGFTDFAKMYLFKNNKMYEFSSVDPITPDALRHFVDNISDKNVGMDVPPMPTRTDELREEVREFIRKPPPMAYATLGCTVTLVVGTCVSIAFPRRRRTLKVA